jgi:predicted transcriptional regulator
MRVSKLDKVKEDVLRLYHKEGKTSREIAEIYGMTFKAVTNWLNANGGTRNEGPVKEHITADDEELWPNERFEQLELHEGMPGRSNQGKSEIYEDLMEQVLEDLKSKKITKTEAQLKYMFLADEFEELGQLDFDLKYKDKVFNAKE